MVAIHASRSGDSQLLTPGMTDPQPSICVSIINANTAHLIPILNKTKTGTNSSDSKPRRVPASYIIQAMAFHDHENIHNLTAQNNTEKNCDYKDFCSYRILTFF